MDRICDNQFLDIPQEVNQYPEINQQEMVLELLDVLLEKGDIRADELHRAKHLLYSEHAR